tara:strand:- start:9 stop:287 length:279 start_codon:yes stop_codon:yes gene_type:complete
MVMKRCVAELDLWGKKRFVKFVTKKKGKKEERILHRIYIIPAQKNYSNNTFTHAKRSKKSYRYYTFNTRKRYGRKTTTRFRRGKEGIYYYYY